MASRIFRVDLAEGARDFKHIATEPGLGMLDPQNVNYYLIAKWLRDLAAEPDWESSDVVSFYVREPEHGRLENITRAPATPHDLQGKLSGDLEAIGRRLRRVKPESVTEQLLHKVLTQQYKHITEAIASGSADCCFVKYRRPGQPWRLVWCWGYQRRELEPAKACYCTNEQCAHLFVQRKGSKARCPICSTVPRRRKSASRLGLRTALLALLLIGVLLLAWLGRPRLVVTPEQWSGPRGSRVKFQVHDRRWFIFDNDVSDLVVAQSHDTRRFEFTHGATGRARREGQAVATFYYGGSQTNVGIRVGPPLAPKSLRLEPTSFDLAIGSTQEIHVFGQYDGMDDVELTDVVELSVAESAIAEVQRDRLYGMSAGKTTAVATYSADGSSSVKATADVAVSQVAYTALSVIIAPEQLARGHEARVSVVAKDAEGQVYDLIGSPSLKIVVDPPTAGRMQYDYFIAEQTGTASISATFGALSDAIQITIDENSPVSPDVFSVEPHEVELLAGEFIDVSIVSGGEGGITTESSDSSVAAISDGVRISAMAPGETTVRFQQNGKEEVVKVTVIESDIHDIRIEPNPVTVYVGESTRIRVLGLRGNATTIDLDPDQLVWVKQPLVDYAELIRDSLEVVGRKPTAIEEIIVMHGESLTATARVRVESGMLADTADLWAAHPPINVGGLTDRTETIDPGPLLGDHVSYVPDRGLVVEDLSPVLRDAGVPVGSVIAGHNGVKLLDMTPDELAAHLAEHPILADDVISVVGPDGNLIEYPLGKQAVVFQEVQVSHVDSLNVTETDFIAEVHAQLREAAKYRIVDAQGKPLTDWANHGAKQAVTFRTKRIPLTGGNDVYRLAVEREMGDAVERFPFSFALEPRRDPAPNP